MTKRIGGTPATDGHAHLAGHRSGGAEAAWLGRVHLLRRLHDRLLATLAGHEPHRDDPVRGRRWSLRRSYMTALWPTTLFELLQADRRPADPSLDVQRIEERYKALLRSTYPADRTAAEVAVAILCRDGESRLDALRVGSFTARSDPREARPGSLRGGIRRPARRPAYRVGRRPWRLSARGGHAHVARSRRSARNGAGSAATATGSVGRGTPVDPV